MVEAKAKNPSPSENTKNWIVFWVLLEVEIRGLSLVYECACGFNYYKKINHFSHRLHLTLQAKKQHPVSCALIWCLIYKPLMILKYSGLFFLHGLFFVVLACFKPPCFWSWLCLPCTSFLFNKNYIIFREKWK